MFNLSQIFSLWKGNDPTYLCEIFVFNGVSSDFFFSPNAVTQFSFPFRVRYPQSCLKSRSVQHLVPFNTPACWWQTAQVFWPLWMWRRGSSPCTLECFKQCPGEEDQWGAAGSTVMEWGNLTLINWSFFLPFLFSTQALLEHKEPQNH